MNTVLAPRLLDKIGSLGDETRARILILLDRSEMTVSELCTVLQSAQPTVSRHLRILASEGWVEARVDGRNRHYHVRPDLDAASRALWEIVRDEMIDSAAFQADQDRAEVVLEGRRIRSDAFFAEAAGQWDQMRSELFGSSSQLAPLLGLIRPSWTVADLGCGTGALSARLAPVAGRVVAVDRSPDMLRAARARLGGFPNVDLREARLEKLPLDSGSVDVAILALVLHYVVDPPAALVEVARTLRPGGQLLLIDMKQHDRGHAYAETMGHVWAGFDPDRIAQWLGDAGLGSVRTVSLAPDPAAGGPPLFLASAAA